IGKSALMARIVRHYQSIPKDHLVIPYFFRIGSRLCSTEEFLRAALLHLQATLPTLADPRPDPLERRSQFLDAVHEVAIRSRKRILFFIDGLDEIFRLDSRVVDLPFETGTDALWVCAGRSESALEQRLRDGGAEWVFPDGLPALGEAAIREML